MAQAIPLRVFEPLRIACGVVVALCYVLSVVSHQGSNYCGFGALSTVLIPGRILDVALNFR